MNSKSLFLTMLIGCLAIAAVFSAYPLFKGSAQKGSEGKQPDADALVKLRENPTASRFYDKAKGTDPDLVLLKFQPPTPIEEPRKPVLMTFRKGAEDVTVHIIEYDSAESAKTPFKINLNATVKNYPGHGDEGTKMYNDHGKKTGTFGGLALRKDRFYVAVYCDDEKLAERLAGYALETVTM